MNKLLVFSLFLIFSFNSSAQRPTPRPLKKSLNEAEEMQKAVALTGDAERVAALQKFVKDFPKSAEKNHARELMVSARAAMGDAELKAGNNENGIKLFKLAVADAPVPISDKLFNEVVLQFPTNLFVRGQQAAAIEVANSIESKVSENADQLIKLATFYLGIENGAEASRLALRALAIKPDYAPAYQTLGLAKRVDFNVDESAEAYSKALSVAVDSAISKRNLAEMRRAQGKPDAAEALYREILSKDPSDAAAQTGLVLSLFDSEKRSEAEVEMAKALETNPSNLLLLVGAAYWYAGHRLGAESLDLARKAVALEPRYVWGQIALARALLLGNKPLEAEKALLTARRYGNFPTLDYEIASARLAAGFYEEAAEALSRSFTVKGGVVQTRLGNHVENEGKDFIEILAPERRASIFEPLAADSPENAARLKSLLVFHQALSASDATEAETGDAADDFAKGADSARTYRYLFAADRILRKGKPLGKVLEFTQESVKGIDEALNVPSPAAAVMADELYDSRAAALARDQIVIVPEISRQTLANILRGKIEEISGWALYRQDKPQDAVVRLKRAVSIYPPNSAWSRSGMWRLGVALEAGGNSKDAIEAYVRSYKGSQPDPVKRAVIEALYQKVNGSLDGLDARIGAKTAEETIAKIEPSPSPEVKPTVQPSVSETVHPEKTPDADTSATVEKSVEADSKNETKPSPDRTPEKKADAAESGVKPDVKSSPLFDSVVITVPKLEPGKADSDSKTAETSKTADAKPDASPTGSENIQSGEGRTRIAAENKAEDKSEIKSTGEPQCEIAVSQENISLLNGGGSLGIFASFADGKGDPTTITASSSNPDDIAAALEPDIGKLTNRAFFIIKSVSINKGLYTLTFTAPCGRKEINVKVR
jgi:tetratricopeptide (TPR) repeat protein